MIKVRLVVTIEKVWKVSHRHHPKIESHSRDRLAQRPAGGAFLVGGLVWAAGPPSLIHQRGDV